MSKLADELATIGLSRHLENIEDRLSAIESKVTQQELASRNDARYISENGYPAKSVSSDKINLQKGASDGDVTRKVGSANNVHTTIEEVQSSLDIVFTYSQLEKMMKNAEVGGYVAARLKLNVQINGNVKDLELILK